MVSDVQGANMVSQQYDLGYLKAGLGQLVDYLLSNQLYWTVGASHPPGEPIYPQLTIGTLLLVIKRLQTRAGEGSGTEYFDELSEFNNIERQWKSAWIQKATREFHARMNLWRNYLDDYRKSPADNYDRYAFEVSRRVELELLQPYIDESSKKHSQLLTDLDAVLRIKFVPGDFIWGKDIKHGFPRNNYWYLYGSLRVNS
jgi:hypothetical protein